MGRKSKYETHVLPNLDKVRDWIEVCTEYQIAERLGITRKSFDRYKKQHPELKAAIIEGEQKLVDSLKTTLKKKAHGFYYEEQKTLIRDEDGQKTKVVEKYKRYAQPDTGAIHLLLKNFDDDWRNDDKTTVDLRKEKLEIEKQRAAEGSW